MFEFWTKWGLDYSTPKVVEDSASAHKDDSIANIDKAFELMEKESMQHLSDASTSPIKQTISTEVVDFMKKHHIQAGPWEIYLSRASQQDLEELDGACTHNTRYFRFNHWDISEKGGRRSGEHFLLQYVKNNMPELLHASHRSNGKRKRAKNHLAVLMEAFLCTWELDQAAMRAVSDVDEPVLDDIWKKMETEKCVNASAFVFGKIRRMKTIQFARNPEIDALLKEIDDEKIDRQALINDIARVFKVDSMARESLQRVKAREDLCKIAQELCDRCRHHMVANASVHIVKLCKKAVAAKDPKKAYSSAMKSMMSRQMKLSTLFDKEEAQYVYWACLHSAGSITVV